MDIADRSTASTGGPSSAVRSSVEFSSPTRNMATVSGFSKTLVVAVESLKVGEFDNDEVESKFLLSPHSSTTAGKLSSGKGKSGAKSRRKQSEEVYECDFEEDIIDGFAIVGFNSLEDLEEFATNSAEGKLLLPKCIASTSRVPKSLFLDESSRSSMSSPADEILADRLVKSSRMTAGNRSTINSDSTDTSSNHSVASEATSAMDLATFDERPPSLLSPDDVEATVLTPQSNSSSPEILSLAGGEKHGSSVLRVPTPSSWERFKFSRGNGVPPATDVEMKDSDTPSLPNMQKKLCECKNSKTVGMHCGNCKLSVDSHKLLDNQKNEPLTGAVDGHRAVATSPIAISIKIEDSSPPPPSLHQQNVVSTKLPARPFGHFESNLTARIDDRCSAKPPNLSNELPDEKPASVREFDTKGRGSACAGSVKSRRCSPEHCSSVDIRSLSRSPSLQRCQSRSHSSRHSVEIKSERSTPPVVKKSSSHHSSTDRYTPRMSNSSAAFQATSSFPLYTPAAVPASYLSASNPSSFHHSSFDSGLSYPFRGIGNPGSSMFVPPSPSVSLNPSLVMGLQNQFGHDALLNAAANQEMLARMQQELNSRFLHDRSLLPLGLPSMPFTLHTEMHQHQHLHHHQHVVTPGFLPPPSAAGLFATPMAMKLSTGNDLLLHSQNLTELAERERLAKMAGLSGFSGLNVHNGLSFNQGLHSGAFQPKVPAAASGLNSASQLLLSLREHENLARNSSLTSVAKRRGRWCAAHVHIAWKIRSHQHSKISDAAAFRASLDAAEMASLRAGFGAAEAASLRAAEVASLRAGLGSNGLSAAEAASLRAGIGAAQQSTDHLRSGLLGGLAGTGPGEIHAGLLGQGGVGMPNYPAPSLDMLGRLAQSGLETGNAAMFSSQQVNPSLNLIRPQVGPSPSALRPVNSPAPHHHSSKQKPELNRREPTSDRHAAVSSVSSHRSHTDVKSEHSSTRHRDHFGSSSLSSSSMTRSTRSPDRHHSRHRDRSRSRSPMSSQVARHQADVSVSTSRTSDSRGAVKDAEMRVGHRRYGTVLGESSSAALLTDPTLRNGFPAPGGPSGHAFASVPPLVKPPSANGSHLAGPHLSALERERDARQQTLRQQQERDRLPFSASAAAAAAAASGFAASLMPNPMLGSNCDAAFLLRERMMTDQRDRMLLAAAAAEYESRSRRATDHPGLRSAPMGPLNGLYQPPLPNPHAPDALLGGASGMMLAAAQSALLRPSLNQPPLAGPPGLKLPSTFGQMMDSAAVGNLTNAAAHLNLPFR